MPNKSRLYTLLAEIRPCTTLNEAVNTLAKVTSNHCGGVYASVYLRDYTGENLVLSGHFPSPVTENEAVLVSRGRGGAELAITYCPHRGQPQTLSMGKEYRTFLSAAPSENMEHPIACCFQTGQSTTIQVSSLAEFHNNTGAVSSGADMTNPTNPTSQTSQTNLVPDKQTAYATPKIFDSFFPLPAPGGSIIGTLVFGHHGLSPAHKKDIELLCLYAGAVIHSFVTTRKTDALVNSLHEDLQRLTAKEKAEAKLSQRIIGTSKAMQTVKKSLLQAALSLPAVFISGETGTGKSFMARAIHDVGPRHDKNFIPINCAAIPHNLFESELFGYVKGAFSGATKNYEGLLRAAKGGTVFLDEVGELPTELQATLLQTIQDKTVRPLGSVSFYPIDVRIIAATNRSIPQALEEKTLRQDLYHRLSALVIHIPPLRERPEDIPPLAEFLFETLTHDHGKEHLRLSPELLIYLRKLPLKGNVRELSNIIEQIIIAAENATTATINHIPSHHLASQQRNNQRDGLITAQGDQRHGQEPSSRKNQPMTALAKSSQNLPQSSPEELPEELPKNSSKNLPRDFSESFPESFSGNLQGLPLSQRVEAYEKSLIVNALLQYEGDLAQCAKVLDVHPKTLSRRIAKYALGPYAFKPCPHKAYTGGQA